MSSLIGLMEILCKKMLTTVFQASLLLICWCTTTNNHQRVLRSLQLCFLFITTGIWIYGLQNALEFWLTDWESFYFINTTWFNKQEIRKLILRNEPPENIFEPEDNHANKSEAILFALLCTDATCAVVQKHSMLQGLYKLLEGRKCWNSMLEGSWIRNPQ